MSSVEDKRSSSEEKDWVSRKTLRPKETLRRAKEHLMKFPDHVRQIYFSSPLVRARAIIQYKLGLPIFQDWIMNIILNYYQNLDDLPNPRYKIQGQYKEAIPLLRRIKDYVIEATFVLGVIYFEGIHVKVDKARGINYMKNISKISTLLPEEELFVRQAQLNLGNLYYRGVEVPKSDENAERYWLLAASGKKNPDTGRPHPPTVEAQTALGKFYSLGKTRNIEKALYWHNRAYSNGSFASEACLGMMLMWGIGVSENPVKACFHLVNASLKGSIIAYGLLAAMYYKRQMYYKVVEIGKWLTKIEDMKTYAEHCNCPLGDVRSSIALGSFYLGLCYQYGYAVKKDLSIAKQILQKAFDLRPKLGRKLHIRAIIGDL